MKNTLSLAALTLGLAFSSVAAMKDPMVGGAKMYPTKNIVENAMNSKDHTTLVAAIKAAGLVDTLEGAGPFTVFAPTNEAFAKLPAGTVDNLVKPENKDTLSKILTYHVVSGRVTASDLKQQIKAGGGTATLKTVNGENLTAMMTGGKVQIKDEKGNVSTVTIPNVYQSNGVIHVIDSVLMP
ncbi:MAG: fasciclin domain-containing protein [Acidobacteriota bacterium]|nr:fasciclin domain-containing protein [Acidobacteriota bacterium]